jgi:hypothetical protein
MNPNFPKKPELPKLRLLEKPAPERVCCAEISTGTNWDRNIDVHGTPAPDAEKSRL